MIQFSIPDMHCDACVRAITQAVHGVDPTASIETDLSAHRVRIDSAASASLFSDAIDAAGFTVDSAA